MQISVDIHKEESNKSTNMADLKIMKMQEWRPYGRMKLKSSCKTANYIIIFVVSIFIDGITNFSFQQVALVVLGLTMMLLTIVMMVTNVMYAND